MNSDAEKLPVGTGGTIHLPQATRQSEQKMKLSEADIDFSLFVTQHQNVANDLRQELLLHGWKVIDVVFDSVSDEAEMHRILKDTLRLYDWYHTSYDALNDALGAVNEIFENPRISVFLHFIGEDLFQWKDKLVSPLLDTLEHGRRVFGKEFDGVRNENRLAIVWLSIPTMFPTLGRHHMYSIRTFDPIYDA